MFIARPSIRLSIGILIALPLVAASNAGLKPRPAWWRDASAAARVGIYVTQTNGAGTTELFGYRAQNRANDPPLCTISGLSDVVDIASDQAGNVYVPSVVGDTVTVYAPGCGKQLTSIYDPFGAPQGVSFHGDTAYVASGTNVATCDSAGCGNVLTDPSIFEITGSAVDSKGNVWAAYYSTKGAVSLIVWPSGSLQGHPVSGYQDGPVPGGILFDAKDTLISVFSGFSQIDTYSCHVSSRSCTLTRSLATQGRSNFAALNRRNTDLAVSDFTNTSVDIYSYPGLRYEYSFDSGLSSGSAARGITQTR